MSLKCNQSLKNMGFFVQRAGRTAFLIGLLCAASIVLAAQVSQPVHVDCLVVSIKPIDVETDPHWDTIITNQCGKDIIALTFAVADLSRVRYESEDSLAVLASSSSSGSDASKYILRSGGSRRVKLRPTDPKQRGPLVGSVSIPAVLFVDDTASGDPGWISALVKLRERLLANTRVMADWLKQVSNSPEGVRARLQREVAAFQSAPSAANANIRWLLDIFSRIPQDQWEEFIQKQALELQTLIQLYEQHLKPLHSAAVK